jgi:hypothetical protein
MDKQKLWMTGKQSWQRVPKHITPLKPEPAEKEMNVSARVTKMNAILKTWDCCSA